MTECLLPGQCDAQISEEQGKTETAGNSATDAFTPVPVRRTGRRKSTTTGWIKVPAVAPQLDDEISPCAVFLCKIPCEKIKAPPVPGESSGTVPPAVPDGSPRTPVGEKVHEDSMANYFLPHRTRKRILLQQNVEEVDSRAYDVSALHAEFNAVPDDKGRDDEETVSDPIEVIAEGSGETADLEIDGARDAISKAAPKGAQTVVPMASVPDMPLPGFGRGKRKSAPKSGTKEPGQDLKRTKGRLGLTEEEKIDTPRSRGRGVSRSRKVRKGRENATPMKALQGKKGGKHIRVLGTCSGSGDPKARVPEEFVPSQTLEARGQTSMPAGNPVETEMGTELLNPAVSLPREVGQECEMVVLPEKDGPASNFFLPSSQKKLIQQLKKAEIETAPPVTREKEGGEATVAATPGTRRGTRKRTCSWKVSAKLGKHEDEVIEGNADVAVGGDRQQVELETPAACSSQGDDKPMVDFFLPVSQRQKKQKQENDGEGPKTGGSEAQEADFNNTQEVGLNELGDGEGTRNNGGSGRREEGIGQRNKRQKAQVAEAAHASVGTPMVLPPGHQRASRRNKGEILSGDVSKKKEERKVASCQVGHGKKQMQLQKVEGRRQGKQKRQKEVTAIEEALESVEAQAETAEEQLWRLAEGLRAEARQAAEENGRRSAGKVLHPFFSRQPLLPAGTDPAQSQNPPGTALPAGCLRPAGGRALLDPANPCHITQLSQETYPVPTWTRFRILPDTLASKNATPGVVGGPSRLIMLASCQAQRPLPDSLAAEQRKSGKKPPMQPDDPSSGEFVAAAADVADRGQMQDSRNEDSSSWQRESWTVGGARELWVDKYRPTCAEEVCGNQSQVAELYDWLSQWQKRAHGIPTQGAPSGSGQSGHNSDSDSGSWLCGDDSDIEDDDVALPSALLLSGPPGSGKTTAVHACACQLGFTVIEVNASEQRNGALIRHRFSGAADSHRLATWHSPTSHANLDSPQDLGLNEGKRKSKKTRGPAVLPAMRTTAGILMPSLPARWHHADKGAQKKLTLLLFDEVDLLPNQDSGFLPAVAALAAKRKRPIVLVSNTKDVSLPGVLSVCQVALSRPSSKDLLELATRVSRSEGLLVAPSLLACHITTCKNDIRKVLNSLQFWTQRASAKCPNSTAPISLAAAPGEAGAGSEPLPLQRSSPREDSGSSPEDEAAREQETPVDDASVGGATANDVAMEVAAAVDAAAAGVGGRDVTRKGVLPGSGESLPDVGPRKAAEAKDCVFAASAWAQSAREETSSRALLGPGGRAGMDSSWRTLPDVGLGTAQGQVAACNDVSGAAEADNWHQVAPCYATWPQETGRLYLQSTQHRLAPKLLTSASTSQLAAEVALALAPAVQDALAARVEELSQQAQKFFEEAASEVEHAARARRSALDARFAARAAVRAAKNKVPLPEVAAEPELETSHPENATGVVPMGPGKRAQAWAAACGEPLSDGSEAVLVSGVFSTSPAPVAVHQIPGRLGKLPVRRKYAAALETSSGGSGSDVCRESDFWQPLETHQRPADADEVAPAGDLEMQQAVAAALGRPAGDAEESEATADGGLGGTASLAAVGSGKDPTCAEDHSQWWNMGEEGEAGEELNSRNSMAGTVRLRRVAVREEQTPCQVATLRQPGLDSGKPRNFWGESSFRSEQKTDVQAEAQTEPAQPLPAGNRPNSPGDAICQPPRGEPVQDMWQQMKREGDRWRALISQDAQAEQQEMEQLAIFASNLSDCDVIADVGASADDVIDYEHDGSLLTQGAGRELGVEFELASCLALAAQRHLVPAEECHLARVADPTQLLLAAAGDDMALGCLMGNSTMFSTLPELAPAWQPQADARLRAAECLQESVREITPALRSLGSAAGKVWEVGAYLSRMIRLEEDRQLAAAAKSRSGRGFLHYFAGRLSAKAQESLLQTYSYSQ